MLHLLRVANGTNSSEIEDTSAIQIIRQPGRQTHNPALERLRLPYRVLLSEQGFVLLYCHVSQLQLEVANASALHTANTECPQCKATGRVLMHHGLRDKECPRCGGRGWVRATPGR